MSIDEEKLSNERVENTKKRVAHALNLLETASQEMNEHVSLWAGMGWNDEVVFQMIEEDMLKLGMALATLERWHDDNDVSEV